MRSDALAAAFHVWPFTDKRAERAARRGIAGRASSRSAYWQRGCAAFAPARQRRGASFWSGKRTEARRGRRNGQQPHAHSSCTSVRARARAPVCAPVLASVTEREA
eukprot:3355285-Pleurochrysis_carterae.AAC.1